MYRHVTHIVLSLRSGMDDLAGLSREELLAEVKRLRDGIREHRDSTGQDLCWHHPKLWSLLPERTDPLPMVPVWPDFLHGCVRYRRSLDDVTVAGSRVVVRAAATMSWRRLDVPGHDACALLELDDGWRLEGAAVFLDERDRAPVWLAYEAECDRAWRSRSARAHGFAGAAQVGAFIERDASGAWCVNGARSESTRDCIDVDLGFTPATNLFQLRRIALADGGSADVPVAWLDVNATSLARVPQRYERVRAGRYRYDAPSVPYAAELDVDESGFVTSYPALWTLER
jgi:hypothetical protein